MRPPALKNCGAGQQFTLFAQDHRFDKGHCNDIKGEFGQILHTDTVVLPWLLQKFKNSIVTFYPHTKKSETQKKRNEKPYIHAQKKNHPSLLQQKISPTIPPPIPTVKKICTSKSFRVSAGTGGLQDHPMIWKKTQTRHCCFREIPQKLPYICIDSPKKGVIQWPFTNWSIKRCFQSYWNSTTLSSPTALSLVSWPSRCALVPQRTHLGVAKNREIFSHKFRDSPQKKLPDPIFWKHSWVFSVYKWNPNKKEFGYGVDFLSNFCLKKNKTSPFGMPRNESLLQVASMLRHSRPAPLLGGGVSGSAGDLLSLPRKNHPTRSSHPSMILSWAQKSSDFFYFFSTPQVFCCWSRFHFGGLIPWMVFFHRSLKHRS